MTVAYIRVSSDPQQTKLQKHALLEWSQHHRTLIDGFIEIEDDASKQEGWDKINALNSGDRLVAVELSHLGKNMRELFELIAHCIEHSIALSLVSQSELSLDATNPYQALIQNVFTQLEKTQKRLLSRRMENGKAKSTQLGRPKGVKNKSRMLDPYRDEIVEYLNIGLNMAGIHKMLNAKAQKPIKYATLRLYIESDEALKRLRDNSSQ